MTLKTCGAISERAQMNLVWINDLGIENTFNPFRLRVVRLKS